MKPPKASALLLVGVILVSAGILEYDLSRLQLWQYSRSSYDTGAIAGIVGAVFGLVLTLAGLALLWFDNEHGQNVLVSGVLLFSVGQLGGQDDSWWLVYSGVPFVLVSLILLGNEFYRRRLLRKAGQ